MAIFTYPLFVLPFIKNVHPIVVQVIEGHFCISSVKNSSDRLNLTLHGYFLK